ncbi:MAG TPA: NAD(P)H-binding protein [Pseudonocardiaceae bacterium]|jgi:hypothetical protein|nr:NAD(P)H-binding protein [Pseudonocardiaceae bacterium]
MQLIVLAASGATGRQLTGQALQRGHHVTAIARRPERITVPDSDRLTRVAADVHDPESIARALKDAETVLSGLGIAGGDPPGALTAGARAVVAAAPDRIIWLGAVGTGASAPAAGWATRTLLRAFMGAELTDKVAADSAVLAAGGTVFHAGPLSSGPLSRTRRTVGLTGVPKRLFPARVSRATVAAAMLDEAETPRFPGVIAVPLER